MCIDEYEELDAERQAIYEEHYELIKYDDSEDCELSDEEREIKERYYEIIEMLYEHQDRFG